MPSALNGKVKKFNQARVNGGSNYDSRPMEDKCHDRNQMVSKQKLGRIPSLVCIRGGIWKDSLGNQTNPNTAFRGQLNELVGEEDITPVVDEGPPVDAPMATNGEECYTLLIPSTEWSCDFCSITQDSLRKLVKHMHDTHAGTLLVFRCRKCGKSGNLHGTECHSGQCKGGHAQPVPITHPHKCPECPSGFTSKIGLGQHIRHKHPKVANDKRIQSIQDDILRKRSSRSLASAADSTGAPQRGKIWTEEADMVLRQSLERIPQYLKESRSILLPIGKKDLNLIGNWRPLTISSILLRLYSKVLAKRLTAAVPLNPIQRGFIPAPGVSENTQLLARVIKQAKARKGELAVAFLDLAKAFDTVSHDLVRKGMQRFGIPDFLVNVVADMYEGAITTFTVKGGQTEPIAIGSGIKQGDPLSPILLDMALDPLLCLLETEGEPWKIGRTNLTQWGTPMTRP
ncbi:hypothetical protein ACOMHN_030314 [Nucella lapillus]